MSPTVRGPSLPRHLRHDISRGAVVTQAPAAMSTRTIYLRPEAPRRRYTGSARTVPHAG